MGTLITPAFWDLHLHGVAGIDFMHASTDECVAACENLGRHGTGAFAPTLLTAEPKLLLEACLRWGAFLSRTAKRGYLPRGAALPIGLHLEGPFLNPRMAGAHPRSDLKAPSFARAAKLVAAANGHVAIVTLAPELPGALELTRGLARAGIRVQMGHTLATSEQALRATRAGATGITHLYNAMRTHHREPGVIAPLARGLVTAELITDGVHLAPDFVHWCRHAAHGRLYAVSDGCAAVGARPGQRLTLGTLQLRREGPAALVKSSGTLAGGATYLCDHPQRLAHGMTEREKRIGILPLFYGHQRHFFPLIARAIKGRRNAFDAQTLRFLGTR